MRIRAGSTGKLLPWLAVVGCVGVLACVPPSDPPASSDDLPLESDSDDVGIDPDTEASTSPASDTEEQGTDSPGGPSTDSEPESFEEPPLPPPLSTFYAEQVAAMQARRAVCGIDDAPTIALPEGLASHLATADEYDHHTQCLKGLAVLHCASEALGLGALSQVASCLYRAPAVYDALDPPPECSFQVEGFPFDVRRQRFSLRNAYFLLNLSILSKLESSAEALKALSPLGYIAATITTKNRLQVLMAEHADHVVLAFKGTTEFSDYFSNATYMMLDKSETGLPGAVHKGFYDTLESGWPALLKVMEGAFATGKPVVFTGHSLGGAVAQLAAFKALEKKGLTAASVYMFATPRVGDEAYAKAYVEALGDVSFRINNGMDITPHMPPAAGAEQVAKESLLSLFGEGGLGIDILSGILDLCLELADYTQVGKELWIDPEGYLYGWQGDDVASDVGYWAIAVEMFADWSIPDITGVLPVLHDDRTHLCYQARLIEELLYERK